MYYTDAVTAEDDRIHLAIVGSGHYFCQAGEGAGGRSERRLGRGQGRPTLCAVRAGGVSHVVRRPDCPPGGRHVGYATSPDGRTWTRHPSNPIIMNAGAVDVQHLGELVCAVDRGAGWHPLVCGQGADQVAGPRAAAGQERSALRCLWPRNAAPCPRRRDADRAAVWWRVGVLLVQKPHRRRVLSGKPRELRCLPWRPAVVPGLLRGQPGGWRRLRPPREHRWQPVLQPVPPTRASSCLGSTANCQKACKNIGATTGYCGFPGSTNPGACCLCY